MKRALFVCVENSCRSQMAEAFLNLAQAPDWQGFSAGSNPSGIVNKKAIAAMAELGYDLSTHQSKGIDSFDEPFDFVITMGCGDRCPAGLGGVTQDWDLPDPKHMEMGEFREVRDEIRLRVESLIKGF